MNSLSRKHASGCRICTLEKMEYTFPSARANLATLARVHQEARRRGHKRAERWIACRVQYWTQFFPDPAWAVEAFTAGLDT